MYTERYFSTKASFVFFFRFLEGGICGEAVKYGLSCFAVKNLYPAAKTEETRLKMFIIPGIYRSSLAKEKKTFSILRGCISHSLHSGLRTIIFLAPSSAFAALFLGKFNSS